jgi:hypothetical protein
MPASQALCIRPVLDSGSAVLPVSNPSSRLVLCSSIKHVTGVLRAFPEIWSCYPAKCHQLRLQLQLTACSQQRSPKSRQSIPQLFPSRGTDVLENLPGHIHLQSPAQRMRRMRFKVGSSLRPVEILPTMRLNYKVIRSHHRRLDITRRRSGFLEPGTRKSPRSGNSSHTSYPQIRRTREL